jgi:hypothetical protein
MAKSIILVFEKVNEHNKPPSVIPAFLFVFPAQAGIEVFLRGVWPPAPRFRGGRLCAVVTSRMFCYIFKIQ